MAKSTFNLQASNTAFGNRQPAASVQGAPGGPHFTLPKSDQPDTAHAKRPQPTPRASSPWSVNFRAFSTTAVIATLLVAALWLSRPWQRQTLAHRWRQDLHEAQDAIALARIHQLGQLGPHGVRVLGEAVGIPREDVARAARAEVTSLLAQWELIEAKKSSPLVVALAQGMAESIDSFDRDARRFAADTAQRILIWPVDRNTTNRAPLIAACETVLVAVGRPAAPPAVPSPATSSPAASSRAPQPTPAADPIPAEARRLPASVEVTPLPRVPTEATVEVSDEDASEPPPQSASDSDPTPSPTADTQDEPRPLPRELSRAAGDLEQAVVELEDQSKNQPTGFTSQHAAWIRDLNSQQVEVVTQARAELAKLGLGRNELEVARLSTHPDAAVRKKLARALPRLPGIDARTWLEFLSDDPDEEVRRTAQTLLATAGDAQSAARLRERR
jgi:hypothetical protein